MWGFPMDPLTQTCKCCSNLSTTEVYRKNYTLSRRPAGTDGWKRQMPRVS